MSNIGNLKESSTSLVKSITVVFHIHIGVFKANENNETIAVYENKFSKQ